MRPRAEDTLGEALEAFDFGGAPLKAERYGFGHINDTFCVTLSDRRFILQRISAQAFRHPEELMKNIISVTGYLGREIERRGGDRSREALEVLRPRSGKDYFTDSLGGAWRVYPFVEGTVCCQAAETPEQFAAAGRAFGNFQRMLADYPADSLYETVPDFHNTEARLVQFEQALAEDPLGRAADCGPEIRFVLDRRRDCSVCMEARRAGKLPLRVTHNDTKLNNVLLDEKTGRGICVIDLDTTMPGLSVYDYGDAIRYGANRSGEDDCPDVALDLELTDAYTAAYLEGCGGALTHSELDYMPWGARVITLELGMRFLTDYLLGDVYFHTDRPGQNLERCRVQQKLLREMEKHFGEMQEIVNKYRK